MTTPNAATPLLLPVHIERDAFGRLIMTTDDGQTFSDVAPVRAFPISEPDHWISFCDEHGQEILRIDDIGRLAADVRTVVEQELDQREFVPVVRRILSATHHEPSDWTVETDRGRTSFQLNNEDDVRRLDRDQALLVDSNGIRYLIASVRGLDGASRRVLEHFLVLFLVLFAAATCAAADRPLMWIDACEGEPVEEARVVKDLATARVIYLGERHTLERHHATQARVIDELAQGGSSLVVAMEQLESSQQAEIDRFNRGEFDFDGLARAISWEKHWPGYRQYRPVLEAARRAKAPVIGLGPSADAIRAVARPGGVAKLDPEMRKKLPAEMDLRDPPYEKLLAAQMMVHIAASPERLRPMIEAQIARDEAMSAALAEYLASPAARGRKAVVICGAGHVTYSLGTPQRVCRRLHNEKDGNNDRIVILAECGDLRLSPEELAAARPIEISHEQLRAIGRPIGDYVEVAWPAGANARTSNPR